MKNVLFKVKFVLDKRRPDAEGKCHIYVRLHVGQVKSEVSLHESVLPKVFDERSGRLKVRTYEDTRINRKLIEAERTINDLRLRMELNNESLSPRRILDLLRTNGVEPGATLLSFFEEHIKKLSAQKQGYTVPVIRHYIQTRSRLEQYLKKAKKEKILLREFCLPDIIGFQDYLLSDVVKEIGRPINGNTCNRYLKKLKAVMRKALVLNLIPKWPFEGLKLKQYSSKRTYLTEPELERIKFHSLGDNASLDRVRDIFLFSCYTGLRYSDAMSLKSEQIYKDKKRQYWISRVQEKTDEPLHIPILKEAKKIYDKHSKFREKTGYVLPRLANQKVNTGLKVIAELTGIKKPLTHHVGRHTCACLLLNNGIEITAVSKFLGQKSVRSTEVYAKSTQRGMDNIAEIMNKKKK